MFRKNKSNCDLLIERESKRIKVLKAVEQEPAIVRQRHIVYVGGKMGVQESAFRVAAASYSDKIEFVYITREQVRHSNWTET